MAGTQWQTEDDSKLNQLLEKVRNALEEAGFAGLDVFSITLNARTKPQPTCPTGQSAVWGEIRRPDGSIYIGWICK